MKLIIAIVLPDDVDAIIKALIAHDFPAPTRINTVGGFLRKGNATLLLATETERVDEALSIMRTNVRPREMTGAQRSASFRGAAFVLPLDRFLTV